MVSDDLILHEGCLQNGYDELERRRINGEKIGAGAFYFREFPRHDFYRVGVLRIQISNILCILTILKVAAYFCLTLTL